MERHILFGVTAETVGRHMSGLSPPDWWHVLMSVVALQRVIASRMAIHATGIFDQLSDFIKDSPRTLCSVRN
jgi:hypothetical protein